jgi:hypothetical protein
MAQQWPMISTQSTNEPRDFPSCRSGQSSGLSPEILTVIHRTGAAVAQDEEVDLLDGDALRGDLLLFGVEPQARF